MVVVLVVALLLWLPHPSGALTPDEDFAARCAAPGVLVCEGFETPLAPTTVNPGTSGHPPARDPAQYASGAHALRFTIPGKSNANAAGAVALPVGRTFAQQSDLYVQFKQYFSPELLALMNYGFGHWKMAILDANNFCGVVLTSRAWKNFPMMYRGCSSDGLYTTLDGAQPTAGPLLLEQQGDYKCEYGVWKGCWHFPVGVWVTFAVHVHIGTWNAPDSMVEAWVGVEGQPLKQFIRVPRYVFQVLSANPPNAGITQLQLTPYVTGKDSTVDHPTALTWVDEVIVSTQPIPTPASNPIPPPVPPFQLPRTPGWVEIPGTKLSQVNPCPGEASRRCTWTGYDGQQGIITGWGSGAFDTQRNRLLLWGGGHQGYAGNELYAVNLDTFTVERLTDPGLPLNDRYDAIASGTQPSSRHTYDGILYLPPTDEFLSVSGVITYFNGPPLEPPGNWLYHFGQRAWTKLTGTRAFTNPNWVATSYDPVAQQALIADNYCLYSYDPRTQTITARSQKDCTWPPFSSTFYVTSILDPIRRHFYLMGHGALLRADISTQGDFVPRPLVTTGGSTLIQAAWPGLAYDAHTGHLMGWIGGDTVYDFDPDTKVWTPHTFPGGPAPTPTGTLKRWAYSAKDDVFVVVTGVDKNAFALRLPREGPPPVVLDGTTTLQLHTR